MQAREVKETAETLEKTYKNTALNPKLDNPQYKQELARAQIALQLGKNYDQDNELNWGVAVKNKKVNFLKRPKLKVTQRSK